MGITQQDAIPAMRTCTLAKRQTREGQVPLERGQGEARGHLGACLGQVPPYPAGRVISAVEALGYAQP